MTEPAPTPNILELASEIVSAYVSRNVLAPAELPSLIGSVHDKLKDLDEKKVETPQPAEEARPAVTVKQSVTPDYLICLEDGKKYKSLKRHLQTHHGMTPDEYRTKWGLPSTYPMVAPNYSAQRAAFAKTIGLGQIRRTKAAAEAPPPPAPTSQRTKRGASAAAAAEAPPPAKATRRGRTATAPAQEAKTTTRAAEASPATSAATSPSKRVAAKTVKADVAKSHPIKKAPRAAAKK